ncbi:hypothetical protein HPP92_004589 [Vanilla planifolia]|uniref:Uncharacterized protein n=1 Tax=Vanilla planifolia TaxID=51239 RepID=A0A835VK28_VANPL|nr:hypothetical protein HPP92_004589 [Vanilla planifolia]
MAEMQHLKDTLKLHQAEVLHEVQLMTDTFKGDLVEVVMQKDDLDQKIRKLAHLSSENEASLKKLEDALRSKISEQEALVEKYEDLLNKHKQLENSYYEAVEKLNIAEKKLEEMFAKDQIIQKFETVSADQKNEMYKLSESYKEILEKLLLTEVAKTDIDKEMQRLEVQLRLSNQKLKITETEYKEKEDGFKKLVEGLQEELRLLDRQVLKWSGDFRVLNSEYRQTRLALDNGLGISFNELQKLRSASVEDMKYAKLQLAECLSELQEVKAWLESVFHQKIKLQNETRQQELRLRYQQNVILDLKDEASRKGLELAEKSRQLHILEIRVIETETKLKEKEKEVLDKDEEKREAIRQLCLLIEYHWENSNHLPNYSSGGNKNNKLLATIS